MKRNKIKNKILKYLGLATLPLVLTPMTFGLTSFSETVLSTTQEEGKVKKIYSGNAFSGDNISKITLSLTNNLSLVSDNYSHFTLQQNSLAIFVSVDFSNAINKEQMKLSASTGFSSSLYLTTSENKSAIAGNMGSTITDNLRDHNTTDYIVETAFIIPSFDSYYDIVVRYALNGDISTVEEPNDITSFSHSLSIGSSFDNNTRIYTPFSIINSNIINWTNNGGTWGHSGASYSVYIDPQTYAFYNTLKSIMSFSGGIKLTNGVYTYILDLGSVTVSSLNSLNNTLDLHFAAANSTTSNTYVYNEVNPTWNHLITSPVDFTGYTPSLYGSFKVTTTDGSIYSSQIANPVNIVGLVNPNVISTNPTAPTEKDGKIEVTNNVAAKQALIGGNKSTEIKASINAANKSSSISKTLSLSTMITLENTLNNVGIGYFNLTFALTNNNISSKQTVYKVMETRKIDSIENITPLASVETNLNTNGNRIISDITFYSKRILVDGKTQVSQLNLEKSKLDIYYDNKMFDSFDFSTSTIPPFRQAVTILNYSSISTLIDQAVYDNPTLWSFKTTLVYDILEDGQVIKTLSMDPDTINYFGQSGVSQYTTSSSSGLSAGAISGIVVGTLAVAGMIGLYAYYDKQKNKTKSKSSSKKSTTKTSNPKSKSSTKAKTK